MGDRYGNRGFNRRSPPPRDRPIQRDRDDHPDVEYFGAGESYRPGGSTGEGPYRPNRDRDRDRDTWSSDRRDDRRREDIDSYIPPTSARAQRNRSRSPPNYRRRSRSPAERSRTELFPERARSPPRRYSPHRDNRPRSPARRRSRSPYASRPRSPVSRSRDLSPRPRSSPRGASPPRDRYERARSPPRRSYSPARGNSYRTRSRTPPRRDDKRPNYAEDTWRRRSPSPRASGTTSRRTSPPVHHDRASLTGSASHSPAYSSRNQYDSRRDEPYSNRQRSLSRDYNDRSRDPSLPRDDYQRPDGPRIPPSGPRGSGYDRPPPTGPSRGFSQSSAPPQSTSQVSVSAHGHGLAGSNISPPTGPRGAPSVPQRDFVSPPGAMRGRTSLTYRAPGYRAPTYGDAPPAGPRGPSYSRGDFNGTTSSSRGDFNSASSSRGGGYAATGGYGRGSYSQDFAFRGNSSGTSSTYPRTQRFNTVQSHLSTLEKIVPGGKKLPSGLSGDQEKRMKQLEDDAEKMRVELADKQRTKRDAINEWEVRERESELAGLRSELAEDHLRKITEEDTVASAAF